MAGREYDFSYSQGQAILRMNREMTGGENYWCVWCGYTSPQRSDFNIDHIIPGAKGGDASLENLCILCRTCNNDKSDHGMPSPQRSYEQRSGNQPALNDLQLAECDRVREQLRLSEDPNTFFGWWG